MAIICVSSVVSASSPNTFRPVSWIAFTEVFGGFSKEFYDSYNENFPLHENYDEIKQIYQLYYILVHFIMFGESYGKRIDEILNYYVSK